MQQLGGLPVAQLAPKPERAETDEKKKALASPRRLEDALRSGPKLELPGSLDLDELDGLSSDGGVTPPEINAPTLSEGPGGFGFSMGPPPGPAPSGFGFALGSPAEVATESPERNTAGAQPGKPPGERLPKPPTIETGLLATPPTKMTAANGKPSTTAGVKPETKFDDWDDSSSSLTS